MKKFIAFVSGQCSQICTKEEAKSWAAKHMASNPKCQAVFIGEVMETAERADNPVITKQFFCAAEDEPKGEFKATA